MAVKQIRMKWYITEILHIFNKIFNKTAKMAIYTIIALLQERLCFIPTCDTSQMNFRFELIRVSRLSSGFMWHSSNDSHHSPSMATSPTFPRLDYFILWLWFTYFWFHINKTYNFWETVISKSNLNKSKAKILGEVKYQGYLGNPVSNRNTSFRFKSTGPAIRYDQYKAWSW